MQPPRVVDGVRDYTPSAIAAQARALAEIRGRLEAMDPRSWPIFQQVDYVLVQAYLNGLDFELGGGCCRVGTVVVPLPEEEIEDVRTKLDAVPRISCTSSRSMVSSPCRTIWNRPNQVGSD